MRLQIVSWCDMWLFLMVNYIVIGVNEGFWIEGCSALTKFATYGSLTPLKHRLERLRATCDTGLLFPITQLDLSQHPQWSRWKPNCQHIQTAFPGSSRSSDLCSLRWAPELIMCVGLILHDWRNTDRVWFRLWTDIFWCVVLRPRTFHSREHSRHQPMRPSSVLALEYHTRSLISSVSQEIVWVHIKIEYFHLHHVLG